MRRVGRLCKRLFRDQSGAAIIEFALIVPLLLALVWGVIESARAFYTVNELSSAARAGARLGATCDLGNPPTMNNVCSSAILQTVKGAFQPLGPSLSDSQIGVVFGSSAGSRFVEVTVTYPYTPILALSGWTLTTLTRKARFRYERQL
jgi:Flp pilus assembly protein TadG